MTGGLDEDVVDFNPSYDRRRRRLVAMVRNGPHLAPAFPYSAG